MIMERTTIDLLAQNDISKQIVNIGEEHIENSVGNLHGGAEYNADIL